MQPGHSRLSKEGRHIITLKSIVFQNLSKCRYFQQCSFINSPMREFFFHRCESSLLPPDGGRSIILHYTYHLEQRFSTCSVFKWGFNQLRFDTHTKNVQHFCRTLEFFKKNLQSSTQLDTFFLFFYSFFSLLLSPRFLLLFLLFFLCCKIVPYCIQ
uniref:Uncharacterized protein n=1 Tax=Cacopsylla melanoneura TaxID=428564 RepID=A0A8D9E7R9_9HEMI